MQRIAVFLVLVVVTGRLGAESADEIARQLASTEASVARAEARAAELRARRDALDQALGGFAAGPDASPLDREMARLLNLAPDLAPFDREDAAEDERWRELQQRTRQRMAELRAAPPDTSEEERKAAEFRRQARERAIERDKAMQELAAGHYCSKCKRPASRIQREENETFEQHLGRVQGRPIPMGEAQIAQARAEYDRQIAGLEDQARRLEAQAEDRRRRHREEIAGVEQQLERDERSHYRTLADIELRRRRERDRFAAEMQQAIDRLQREKDELIARHQAEVERLRRERDRAGDELHRLELERIGLDGERDRLAFRLELQRRWEAEEAARQELERQRELERALREAEREQHRQELATRRALAPRRAPAVDRWSGGGGVPVGGAGGPSDAERRAAELERQQLFERQQERMRQLAAEEDRLRQDLEEHRRRMAERAAARAERERERAGPAADDDAGGHDAQQGIREPAYGAELPAIDPRDHPRTRTVADRLADSLGLEQDAWSRAADDAGALLRRGGEALGTALRDRIAGVGDAIVEEVGQSRGSTWSEVASDARDRVETRLGDLFSPVAMIKDGARNWITEQMTRVGYEVRTGKDFAALDEPEQAFERLRTEALSLGHPSEYLPRLMDRFESFMGVIMPRFEEDLDGL